MYAMHGRILLNDSSRCKAIVVKLIIQLGLVFAILVDACTYGTYLYLLVHLSAVLHAIATIAQQLSELLECLVVYKLNAVFVLNNKS